jgi:hypothetical protein
MRPRLTRSGVIGRSAFDASFGSFGKSPLRRLHQGRVVAAERGRGRRDERDQGDGAGRQATAEGVRSDVHGEKFS